MAATGAAALVGADGVSIALKRKKKTIKEKDLIRKEGRKEGRKEANQKTSKQKSAQCISTKKTSIYDAFFFYGLIPS